MHKTKNVDNAYNVYGMPYNSQGIYKSEKSHLFHYAPVHCLLCDSHVMYKFEECHFFYYAHGKASQYDVKTKT